MQEGGVLCTYYSMHVGSAISIQEMGEEMRGRELEDPSYSMHVQKASSQKPLRKQAHPRLPSHAAERIKGLSLEEIQMLRLG